MVFSDDFVESVKKPRHSGNGFAYNLDLYCSVCIDKNLTFYRRSSGPMPSTKSTLCTVLSVQHYMGTPQQDDGVPEQCDRLIGGTGLIHPG